MTPTEALPRIVAALGGRGRPSATGWFSCRCPIHGDRHASLSVGIGRSGGLVVHCFAGCGSDLIVANLRARGLWSEGRADAAAVARLAADGEEDRLAEFREAREIWHEAVPLALTPGAHYLRHWRAIRADPGPRLRWHWDRFALIALVTDPITDSPTGVQITPLDRLTHRREGGVNCVIGNKTRPETWRFERRCDPGRRHFVGASGVVRLIDGPGELLIGEGIETTLSGAELVGAGAAWATLGAGGIKKLRLPLATRAVGLLVDCDPNGAGEAACATAAARLSRADPRRAIRLLRPRPPHNDFNDVARARLGGLP